MFFGRHEATGLIDSGASTDFIDSSFVRCCELTLAPSSRSIKLADGSLVNAQGQAVTTCGLVAAKGDPIPYAATFTATPLEGYDMILGMSWLRAHDPLIGWNSRSITVRPLGTKVQRLIRPLECLSEEPIVAWPLSRSRDFAAPTGGGR